MLEQPKPLETTIAQLEEVRKRDIDAALLKAQELATAKEAELKGWKKNVEFGNPIRLWKEVALINTEVKLLYPEARLLIKKGDRKYAGLVAYLIFGWFSILIVNLLVQWLF